MKVALEAVALFDDFLPIISSHWKDFVKATIFLVIYLVKPLLSRFFFAQKKVFFENCIFTSKVTQHTVLATEGKSPEIKELEIVDFIPKFHFLFNIIL